MLWLRHNVFVMSVDRPCHAVMPCLFILNTRVLHHSLSQMCDHLPVFAGGDGKYSLVDGKYFLGVGNYSKGVRKYARAWGKFSAVIKYANPSLSFAHLCANLTTGQICQPLFF